MSTGGLSTRRLARIHDVMTGYVERGTVPGLVTAISRHGEVHVETIGVTAVGVDGSGAEAGACLGGALGRAFGLALGSGSGSTAARRAGGGRSRTTSLPGAGGGFISSGGTPWARPGTPSGNHIQ